MAIFDLLLSNTTAKDMRTQFGISKSEFAIAVRELESVSLLERFPNEKVKLLVQGEPVWRKNGPLQTAFKKDALQDFLNQEISQKAAALRFGIYKLNPIEVQRARLKVSELLESLQMGEKKSKNATDTKSFGVLLSIQKFDWIMECLGSHLPKST